MTPRKLYVYPFALVMAKPIERLEDRMIRFLESQPDAESLDKKEFSQLSGDKAKADYLLDKRRIVAELKTIKGDPKIRVEDRLKKRFAQPGAPIVFGRVGVSAALRGLSDEGEVVKMMYDLSARAVRRHLQKSDEQILVTKSNLNLSNSVGMTIIMNDREEMIDAIGILHAIKSTFEVVESGYPNVDFVWASIEAHEMKLPGGGSGFPQLIISRSEEHPDRLDFLGRLIAYWAQFNGAKAYLLPHHGDWEVLRPIFENGPPTLDLG